MKRVAYKEVKRVTWRNNQVEDALYQGDEVIGPSMHTEWRDKFDSLVVYSYNTIIAVCNSTEHVDFWYLNGAKYSTPTSRLQNTIRRMAKYTDIEVNEYPDEETFKQAVRDSIGNVI